MGSVSSPFAPLPVAGVDYQPPTGKLDLGFSYVQDIILTANQLLRDQMTPIIVDADFIWRGLIFSSTGAFQIRFSDSQGYYFSNSFVNSVNLPNSGANPFPVFPEAFFPRSGKIGVDIQDLSGAGNTVELVFVGVNRYDQ